MKKLLLLLAIVLCAGIICACGEKNDAAAGFTDDGTEIPAHKAYYSELCGYKIIGYDQAAGKEYHHLYHTSDNGSTWNEVETNLDSVYPHMVTGIGFLNESVGFITCRYDSYDFNPAILKTSDGGVTWERQTGICDLLGDYTSQGFMLEPSSPVFEDGVCYINIEAIRHNEKDDDVIDVTIVSEDCENWKISAGSEAPG